MPRRQPGSFRARQPQTIHGGVLFAARLDREPHSLIEEVAPEERAFRMHAEGVAAPERFAVRRRGLPETPELPQRLSKKPLRHERSPGVLPRKLRGVRG